MSKNTANKASANKASANKANETTTTTPAVAQLDWTAESARIAEVAKTTPGSKGNELQKIARYLGGTSDGVELMRAACGQAGAAAILPLSRNVLSKLPKLAAKLAVGAPWCSLAGLADTGSKKEDASVAFALGTLGAGDSRQKSIIASAVKRYPGGATAQMPAALEAARFFGIIKRADNATARNADYVIVDAEACAKLIPKE